MNKYLAPVAALLLVAPAAAEPYRMTYYLVAQWLQNGQQFCKYSNGTVLNVGFNYCPLSIRA